MKRSKTHILNYRLDEINSTLNNSERHLNGMKSIFGGIRNYLFAKRSGVPIASNQSGSLETSSVQVDKKLFNLPVQFCREGFDFLENVKSFGPTKSKFWWSSFFQ